MLRVRRSLLAPALAAVLTLGGTASASAACRGAAATAASSAEVTMESAILCLVNKQRTAAGLRAVAPDPRLRAAAVRHSSEMVAQGYFAHSSPAGESFVDRVLEAGYARGARAWLVGENLAWGTGALSTPASIVQSWMQSPPHRANLLRSRFREVGIGVVRGTPFGPSEIDGATVASEYGFVATKKKNKKKKKKKKKRRRR